MTAMKISLSTQNAPEIWGKNAILSANDAGLPYIIRTTI